MNKLIVLAGVPGSGKSYISILIKDRMRNGHVYVVSSDNLRTQVCGNQQCFDYDYIVWNMYYDLARVYSADEDGIVILDSTAAKRMFRINQIKPLKPLFNEVDLVIFNLDKVTVMRQNIDRQFPVPTEVLERLYDSFEKVNDEDRAFFDNIYEVNNQNLKPIIDDIVK
ncbi:MAG: ATP-binding protein [Bacilli bacterium]|nr:ATP-binding protein [Bacilli bacterium]